MSVRRCPIFVFVLVLAACGKQASGGVDGSALPPDAVSPSDASTFPDASASFDASTNTCGLFEASPDEVLDAFAKTGDTNLYVVDRVDEECSDIGGTHVTLRFVEGCSSRASVVHLGGHGCSLVNVWHVGDLLVAAVDRGAATPSPNQGWCLGALPTYDGEVRAFIQVQSRDEGTQVLSLHGCAP